MNSAKTGAGISSAIAIIAVGSALYEARVVRDYTAYAKSLSDQVRVAEGRSSSLQRELDKIKKDAASIPPAPSPSVAVQKDPTVAAASAIRADDPLTSQEARRLYLQKTGIQMELNTRQFFAKLGFSDDQWEKYKALILGELDVEEDMQATARAHGLSSKEEEALFGQRVNEARGNLLALLGDDAQKQLIQWNQELAWRNSAGELAAKLLYTDEPLTRQQVEQYVKTVMGVQGVSGRNADGVVFLSDAAMTQLQGLLSPGQFAILQQQQLAHRTDQQMAALSKK